MKKLIHVVTCLLLALALVACEDKQGPQGPKGETGAQGPQGEKGDTPTISISDDGYWVINGEKTNVKAEADAAGDSANPQGLDFYLKDDGTYAVALGSAKYLSEIVIPATYCGKAVTEIAYNGFSGAIELKKITIPDSVTSIGEGAFEDCSSLASVTIGNGVTSISYEAFYYCDSLASITVSADNEYYTSIDGNLYTKDGKTLIRYAIGKTDTSFTIPNGVESIGDHAFSSCSSLTSVTIGEGVVSIGNGAFSNCIGLTSVTIPDSVTSIGDDAFRYCTSLTSVTIPDSVTSIGDNAFLYCDSLNTVYYKGTAAEWSNIVIDDYGNSDLTFATRYYYSETEPTTSGNFWHYNDEGEIVKW